MMTPEQIGMQSDLRKAAILSNFKEFNPNQSISEVIQPADKQSDIQKSEEITPLQTIENKLNENFEKGLVTKEEFEAASSQLEALKIKSNKVV